MKKTLKLIFLVLLFIALLYGVWIFGKAILSWFSELKEVTAIVVASFVGLVSALFTQWYSKAKEISANHRSAKIEVYETFFDIFENVARELKGKTVNAKDFPKKFNDQSIKLSRGMIIWASPRVIKAWSKCNEIVKN